MSVLLIGVVNVIAVFFFTLKNRKNDGFISPVSMLGAGLLYYVTGLILELQVRGWSTITLSTGNAYSLDEGDRVWILLLGLIGYSAFSITYILCLSNQHKSSEIELGIAGSGGQSARFAAVAAAGISLALLVALFAPNLVAAANYEQNVAQSFGNTGYAATLRLTFYSTALLGVILLASSRRIDVIFGSFVAAGLSIWAVYSNDKDGLIFAGLCVGGLYLKRMERLRSPMVLLVGLLSVVAASGLGVVAFSLNRAGVNKSVMEQVESNGLFAGSEAPGPMYSVAVRLGDYLRGELDYDLGSSILMSFVQWIPRGIWPGRPGDVADTFAREVMSGYSAGRGFGFSPIAEGLQAGGPFGVIVQFCVAAWVFAFVRKLSVRSTDSGIDALSYMFFYLSSSYIAFLCFRGSMSTVVTGFFQAVVILIGLRILATFLTAKEGAR